MFRHFQDKDETNVLCSEKTPRGILGGGKAALWPNNVVPYTLGQTLTQEERDRVAAVISTNSTSSFYTVGLK
jgi:hypothetical protein